MKKKISKGQLGENGLPVSRQYVMPSSRRKLLAWGFSGAFILLALVGLSFYFDRESILSNGPLSSAHASLENNCQSCHTSYAEVTSEKCSDCHDSGATALGAYSFSAHYLYHTKDFQRDVPSSDEMACSGCHSEHMGRTGVLTKVSDNRCLTCHEGHQFDTKHPEFEVVTKPEPTTLKFPHVAHVQEFMKKKSLATVEETCVACHKLAENGKHFLALDFDRDCDECHLNSSITTPRLPIAKADTIGVMTLATIQERAEPGSRWSMFTSPSEFRTVGDRLVSKSPLHHPDPWVLENLRELRRQVYPDGGLADLLQSSVDVEPSELKTLYDEAIATLEGYALELRAQPQEEVQEELGRIQASLKRLKEKLEDPYVLIDETEFLLSLQKPRDDLDEETLATVNEVAENLTEPCRTCHVLKDLTIARVQKDQRSLHRAQFNHQAHLLQRGCLDCHQKFPEGAWEFEGDEKPKVDLDASVLNLPQIDTCRECHSHNIATNDCINCHQFHPDKKHYSPTLAGQE